jgi:hypothetical protein
MNYQDICDKYKLTNLTGADLRDANLRGAELENADLRDANLKYADLENADLKYANLRYADLECADLSGADLEGADLRYANLTCANLKSADLKGVNLRGADLENADLRDADLGGADLKGTDLKNTNLANTDIRYISCGNNKEIFTYQISPYQVVYCKPTQQLAIGCKQYSTEEWLNFDDETIASMAKNALMWWNKYKPILIALGILNSFLEDSEPYLRSK